MLHWSILTPHNLKKWSLAKAGAIEMKKLISISLDTFNIKKLPMNLNQWEMSLKSQICSNGHHICQVA